MLNKLPTGKITDPGDVGGGGTGNDEKLRVAIKGINHERKRPRYSICSFALNGPNLLAHPGVWDWISGGGPEGTDVLAPDREDPGAAGDTFTSGGGKILYWEYEMREPLIFMGGQMAVGYIRSPDQRGTTTIHIEKVEDGTSTASAVSIDTYTMPHGADGKLLGPNSDNRDVLVHLPGRGAFFGNGERFRIRIVPDTETAANWYDGLESTSVILWFKALHV